MVKQLSNHIVLFLVRQNIISESDTEIYEYGIKHIMINIINLCIVGMLAIYFRTWAATIGFFIGFMPIRTIAGGYHAKTPSRCNLLSFIIFNLNIYIICVISAYMTEEVYFSIGIIIILIIFVFAPVDHKNRMLSESEIRQVKKQSRIVGLVLVGSGIILFLLQISSNTLLIGALMGSLTSAISLIIGRIVRGGEKNEEINKECKQYDS